MKKLLIGLTVLFSFLFVSNVSAYNSTVINSTSDNWIYLNTYGMTKEEIQQYTNKYISYNSSKTSNIPDIILKCREYYETYYSEKYQYYFITHNFASRDTSYYLLAFNDYPIGSKDKNYIVNSTNDYNSLRIHTSEDTSLDFVYFTTTNGTNFTNMKGSWLLYETVSGITDLNSLTHYYETNYSMDFYLNPYSNGSDIYSKFYYDDKIFSPGDIVFNTMVDNGINIIKQQGPTEPQLDISSTLKNELGEKININFSEFDKEKYIYLYNFNNQPGNENWHEITENDYEYSSILNGILYIKIIDREQFLLNGDTTPIISATYTFTDLLMYEDIIDTYNMADYTEIEYRYYGNNPSMFYYSTYRYGQVPEDTYCITGTGIYDCNILSIREITSNFYYYTTIETDESEYLYKRIFAYEDSPTYSIKEYDHAIIEDLTKYPVNSDFFYNHYRSFTLDLSMYLKEENRGRYIYVYYSTDIYDKTIKTTQSSWNNDTNTNNKLDDLTSETVKPPTYQENTETEDDYFLGFFIDLINKKFPIINQLTFIISTFSFKENEDIPDLTVDLSSIGIPGEVTIIDIETYKQCREMLFFFEYFGICMIGIPKIINNIKSSLGGDK